MLILQNIYLFITWGVIAAAGAAILLILLRALFNYMDINPFTWSAINLKRATDPVILPIRRVLVGFRVDPRAAPLIAILITIVVAFFAIEVVSGIMNTIAGLLSALSSGLPSAPTAILGYLLYGFLGLYTLLIFLRVLSAWFSVGYTNRFVRFLTISTEPLLAPLRRMVPRAGMFDLSPIFAFIIVWVLQTLVAGTLLRGWQVRFF